MYGILYFNRLKCCSETESINKILQKSKNASKTMTLMEKDTYLGKHLLYLLSIYFFLVHLSWYQEYKFLILLECLNTTVIISRVRILISLEYLSTSVIISSVWILDIIQVLLMNTKNTYCSLNVFKSSILLVFSSSTIKCSLFC